MHSLTGWFIRNPVAANLMMAFILFVGTMTVYSMRIEGFPRIPPETITISTTYIGGSSAQVDEMVTQKIEKALEGLEGVRTVTSQSSADYSTVTVRRAGGQDLQKLLDKVRLRIDAIDDLPASADRPLIEEGGFDFPALYLNLHGSADPETLQKLSKRLRENLLAHPDLSRLKSWGLFDREMMIEVEPLVLQRLNLTVSDIVQHIRASSLNFKSGSLRTAGGTIQIKADDQAKFETEYARIPIIERC